MSTLIRLLRRTARLLLVLTPLTVLTGFLAAKWFVAEGWVSPATVRAWHVRWLPLAFLPVVFVHSLCGILFLLRRNERLNRPAVRASAAALWTSVFAVFVWLYLAPAPSAPALPLEVEPDVPSTEEVGDEARTQETTAGEPSAESPDASDGPRQSETPDVPGSVGGDRTAIGTPEGPEGPEASAGPPPADAVETDAAAATPFPAPEPAARPARASRSSRDAPTVDLRRAEAVLARRCTSCHELDQVRSARHDAVGWTASIDRMIGYGAAVTPDERTLLIRYLAGR